MQVRSPRGDSDLHPSFRRTERAYIARRRPPAVLTVGRKNLDRYSDDDWRQASPTVRALIENRWPVRSAFKVCDLVMDTDLTRMARDVGPHFSLWGTTPPCRRRGCPGRVTFYVSPPGALSAIAMTAKRPVLGKG